MRKFRVEVSRVRTPWFLAIVLTTQLAGGARAAHDNDAYGGDRLKVAVMELRVSETIPGEMVPTLTAIVSEELDRMGPFSSISSEDIKRMLGFERFKSLIGCENETSCLAEVGGALGADFLLVGNVMLVEKTYLTQLQLIRIADSAVENRVSREYEGGPLGLFKDIRIAVHLLVRDVLAERSGALMVTAKEEDATVKIDDAIVGVTPLHTAVDVAEGMHTVVLEKEGFVRFRRDVVIRRDATTTLEARLQPSAEFIAAYQQRVRRWRWSGWSVIGLGAVGAIASGVSAAVASDKFTQLSAAADAYNGKNLRTQSELNDLEGRRQEVARLDIVTLVGAVVGAAGFAAGIAILMVSPDEDRYAPGTSVGVEMNSVSLSLPHGSATRWGVNLVGSF